MPFFLFLCAHLQCTFFATHTCVLFFPPSVLNHSQHSTTKCSSQPNPPLHIHTKLSYIQKFLSFLSFCLHHFTFFFYGSIPRIVPHLLFLILFPFFLIPSQLVHTYAVHLYLSPNTLPHIHTHTHVSLFFGLSFFCNYCMQIVLSTSSK